MKKILLSITSFLLLILALIPSVYAIDYIEQDITTQFAGDTSVGVPMINGTGPMGDGWTLIQPSLNIYAAISPTVTIPAGATLNEVKIPNYAIYKTGATQNSVFSKIEMQVFTATGGTPIETHLLQNVGPGGKSYYRLTSPITYENEMRIRFRIEMASTVKSQLPNDHPVLTASNYGINPTLWHYYVESYFFLSVRRSFDPIWIDSQSWNHETNYHASVKLKIETASEPPVDPGDYDSLEDLPATRGSIFTDKLDMGRVFFELDGSNLTALVRYDENDNDVVSEAEEWYLNFNLSVGTDLDIFKNNPETFYYEYEDEKFFVINQGSQSMFLSDDVKNTNFIPYTVWNLTTNEIRSVERINVYFYSVVEDYRNVYAYFYSDDFVIDNLLTATVAMEYRYRYIVEFGGAPAWQPYIKVLEQGQAAFTGVPWWARFLLGAPGLIFPEIYDESSLGFALLGSIANVFGAENPMMIFSNASEIEQITPSSELTQELQEAYNEIGLTSSITLPVYKLHLGYFDAAFSKGVEINPEFNKIGNQKGINIIEMTYETEGQIHTIDGENINVHLNRGPGTDTQPDLVINPQFDIAAIIGIIGGVAIAVLIVVGSAKSFTSYKGFNFGSFFSVLFGGLLAGAIVGGLLWIVVEYLFSSGVISLSHLVMRL